MTYMLLLNCALKLAEEIILMNILLQIETQGFGFRNELDESRAENKLQKMHKAALQYRSACGIFGTSNRGTGGRQEVHVSN